MEHCVHCQVLYKIWRTKDKSAEGVHTKPYLFTIWSQNNVINFFYFINLQNDCFLRCLKNRTWKSWIKYIIWSMSQNYHNLFCLFFLDLGGMLVDNASFVQWTQCFKYLAYYKYLAKIMKNVVWCRGKSRYERVALVEGILAAPQTQRL